MESIGAIGAVNAPNMNINVGDIGGGSGASGISGLSTEGSSGINSLEINQSSTFIKSETNIEISINFGEPNDAANKMMELFGDAGKEEELFELILAIFEEQQEQVMEMFQKLLEMTGMQGSLNMTA